VVTSIRGDKLPPQHILIYHNMRREAENEWIREMEKDRRAADAGPDKTPEPARHESSLIDTTLKHKIKGARGLRLDRQLQQIDLAKIKREKRRLQSF